MSKLATLAEAVASIPSGAHVALSGFAITRCNMAFAREVIRQGIRHLTVSQCVGAMDAGPAGRGRGGGPDDLRRRLAGPLRAAQ
jgi:acyl CoA:acetate/3-ketoacid CoA transferase alpha subunit